MKTTAALLSFLSFIVAVRLEGAAVTLEPLGKIPLPGIRGRLDHMAIDPGSGRLFVAALGNNTVEVVDLRSGTRVHSIAGFAEPQGVLFAPESNTLYVANGENGRLDVIDGTSYAVAKSITFSGNADALRYDPAMRTVYVGYGSGGIAAIDGIRNTVLGTVQFAGHPESFEIEPGGKRLFVNVPARNHVAVLDRNAMSVRDYWPLKGAVNNYPMALDSAQQQLFVGCRKPPVLLVFALESATIVGSAAINGDPDGMWYDAGCGCLYVSCGEGFIDIIQRQKSSGFLVAERIPTATGARTSLFNRDDGRLYVAVPASGVSPAAIWIFIRHCPGR